MKDIKPEFVANGMANVKALFGALVKRNRFSLASLSALGLFAFFFSFLSCSLFSMTPQEGQKAIDRVQAGVSYDGFSDADVIVEAAVERMDLKKLVLQDCQKVMPPHCIFASNTSSLSLTELATVATVSFLHRDHRSYPHQCFDIAP